MSKTKFTAQLPKAEGYYIAHYNYYDPFFKKHNESTKAIYVRDGRYSYSAEHIDRENYNYDLAELAKGALHYWFFGPLAMPEKENAA